MKRLLLFLASLPLYAVGTVTQSFQQIANSSTWVLSINWTGDALNGSVPATPAQFGLAPVQGFRVFSVEIAPGTPAPTNNYNLALTTFIGDDILAGGGLALSSTLASSIAPPPSAPPLNGTLTIKITGNSTASAQGKVLVYFAPVAQVIALTGVGPGLPTNNIFTGTNTFIGTSTFTGPVTAQKLNNVFFVDGVTNTTLFACITAANAVHGVCDDSGLNFGNRAETQMATLATGVVVRLGYGTYTFTNAAGGCFKLGSTTSIIGQNGKGGTVLVNNSNADCMSASVGANGTRGIIIKGVDIRDGFGAGRTVGNGVTIDGRTDEAEFLIENVSISGHMDGLRFYRSLKSDVRNTFATANKSNGFSIFELATSTNLMDTYASANAGHGYYVDGGAQYMTFQNTACDGNTGDCYHFDNIGGQSKHFTLNSPGSENNVGNQIWLKDTVGFTINSPKLATTTGTTKDNIHLEGAQGVVINGGEGFGATGWAMNVISSSTPITPKDVFVLGTNLVAGVSGKLNDPNGAVFLGQGNTWTMPSGTGAGLSSLQVKRCNGNPNACADIWDASANGLITLAGNANGTGIVSIGLAAGAGFQFPENTAPAGSAANDRCYGDSTAHALKCSYNNDAFGTIPKTNNAAPFTVSLRATQEIADQGSICTNGELALSAGWQSTGSATVTAVAGNGQTCSWTITTGTTTAANPTVTDTLTNALPAATTVCEMNIHGGTHTAAAGEGFQQTTLSATAPIFTFNGTPTAGGTTYFVTRRCGP